MSPGLYAMIGAAACLAGVTRMTGIVNAFYHIFYITYIRRKKGRVVQKLENQGKFSSLNYLQLLLDTSLKQI